MAKKKNNFERLEKGEVMYFISSLNYAVVQTHDCYFPTDDDRYFEGNYFPNAKLAHACSDEVIELFVPQLRSLEKLLADNRVKYIKATKEIAEKCRVMMASYTKAKEKEEKKLTLKKKEEEKPDFEPQVLALVDAYIKYKSRYSELTKKTSDVRKEIAEFIRVYPK